MTGHHETPSDSELHNLLTDSVNHFFRDWRADNPPPYYGEDKATDGGDDLWRGLAELGWLGLTLPEHLSGSGLGVREGALVAERMAYWLAPAPLISNAIMPASLLAQSEASAETGSLAASLASGEVRFSVAWQESAGQLYPDEQTATQYRDGQISGQKCFVADVTDNCILLVAARDEDNQMVIVAVSSSAAGVTFNRKPTQQGNMTRVDFDRAPTLGDGPLLQGAAASTALVRAIDDARIALCAWLCGLASRCLEQSFQHLKDREQFGTALSRFQALRHRCSDLYTLLELAGASWHHALDCHEQAPGAAGTRAAISAAKARCNETALAIARAAVQLHGAMGFVEEGGVGPYLRGALMGAAWLGSDRHHRSCFLQHAESVEDDKDQALDTATQSPTVGPEEDLNTLDDQQFRLRFRGFLNSHYPSDLRQDYQRPFRRMTGAETRRWTALMHRHGWRAPEWPKAFGGLGLSFRKQRIYNEECERIGVARMIDNGVTQLGPTLMQYGTEEQQRRYLPGILAAETYWAQGYSEPNAGSDLASLKTPAGRRGDHFVVNGQKIWTTLAMECTHMYALVRTGHYEKKQQGISFLLVDLSSPGIRIRPLRHIAGEEELCEVFFTDVLVPVENLVGPLDEGWTVAKSLLGHERIWLASPNLAVKAMMLARRLVIETDKDRDPVTLDKLGGLALDLHDYHQWYYAICRRVENDEHIGHEASAMKIYITELTQRITDFNLALADDNAAILGSQQIGAIETDLYWQFAMSRPGTIYAGCNEVQRDIVARALLGK